MLTPQTAHNIVRFVHEAYSYTCHSTLTVCQGAVPSSSWRGARPIKIAYEIPNPMDFTKIPIICV